MSTKLGTGGSSASTAAPGGDTLSPVHQSVSALTATTMDVISDIAVLNTKTSSDMGYNPCGDSNGNCEHLCFFNRTKAVCACFHSSLAKDGRSCEPYESYLVYNDGKTLDSLHLFDDDVPNAPMKPILNIKSYALDVDYNFSRLYYSDLSNEGIRSVLLNGSDDELFANCYGSVKGLAVEPYERQLYWTCEHTINRAMLKDHTEQLVSPSTSKSLSSIQHSASNSRVTHKLVQLSKGDDSLRSIALDYCRLNMYWTNWHPGSPSIQRATYTGNHITSIITREILVPNTLTLDLEDDKLYWGDATPNKIERCNLDGSHRTTVYLKEFASLLPFQLRVYDEYLFWADVATRSVYRTNKYSGQTTLLKWRAGEHMSLAVVAPVKEASEVCSSLCPVTNLCSDTCRLDAASQPTCSCLPDRIMESDGHTCSSCKDDEFACGSSYCIPYEYTCNDVAQCPDGSDEDHQYCRELFSFRFFLNY